MSVGIIIAIIAIVLVALIVVWVISVQRRLVSIDELCGNAMSQIGVQQNTRWDALNALADLTKQYDEHEYNTLKDVIAHRQPITANSTGSIRTSKRTPCTSRPCRASSSTKRTSVWPA